ncbi:MAG: arsinothricin resistance N-acetyltransferase ArsN1 family B [Planctomycetota bacterium]|jgi:phosphinothricin acetyltransferase
MSPRIRCATPSDAAQVQAIYAPIVTDTHISFETEPPSEAEMARRMEETLEHLPWLVLEQGEDVLGYAYADPHRRRAAYQWCVESAVYVHDRCRKSGVGRALYISLFKILTLQGYLNVFAGIALPNPSSVRFHESMGFEQTALFRKAGYTLGAWHDVGWWQLELRSSEGSPETPLMLKAIQASPEWEGAFLAGLSCLRQSPRNGERIDDEHP